ncbi:UNVERIFIED_CONTAM: hypothetical protein Sindi_2687000 [Sesamum indicum]
MSSKSSQPSLNRWVKSQSRMAKEAADRVEQQDERDRYLQLERISSCWEETTEELRGERHLVSELKGDCLIPKWNISTNNTVLFTKPRQDSWDLFDSCILPRDQASVLMNAPTRIEEHGAHTLMQLIKFASLSMKCASYRRNQISAEKKVKDLLAQLTEKEKMDQTHVAEMQSLIEEVQSLKNQFTTATEETSKPREIALSEGKKEGFEAGREVGLVEGQKEGFRAGHEQGLNEGKAGRITLEDHEHALSNSRVSIAREFLKSGSFKMAVEIKSADVFNKGYRTCEMQLETLGGFAESFDRSRMDITLDGKLQPYPEEPAPEDDEFSVLLNEIEPDA